MTIIAREVSVWHGVMIGMIFALAVVGLATSLVVAEEYSSRAWRWLRVRRAARQLSLPLARARRER